MRLTQEIIILEQWNNLNSPANPYNYFHGKLIPCGHCEEGNIVYRYNPLEYEGRWVEEGINLQI
jgi:hypothetical protein